MHLADRSRAGEPGPSGRALCPWLLRRVVSDSDSGPANGDADGEPPAEAEAGDAVGEPADAESATGEATRVVVSHPADLSGWGRHQLDTRPFRGWLRRTLGRVEPGDTREVFLDVGCCGDTLDVPLRVERVEGGDRVGPDTEIEYAEREACGVEGGWTVQSRAGADGA